MFSSGQITFAIVFFVAFIVGIFIAYSKDKSKNRLMFKDTYKVLLFVVFVFFALFFLVKVKHYLFP